jgi:hypothetical protein
VTAMSSPSKPYVCSRITSTLFPTLRSSMWNILGGRGVSGIRVQ